MIHKLNNNLNKNILVSNPKSSACFKSCVYNNYCPKSTKSSNNF